MLGLTHIAIGTSFGVLVATSTDQAPTFWEWTALLVGSLAPDLDEGHALIARPGSILARFLPKTLRIILDGIGLAVSAFCLWLFGHRQLLHWPIVALALIASGLVLEFSPLVWFGWGYLLHILADGCTRGGVPLWAPLSRKRVCFFRLRTGSWKERGLAVGLWAYIAYAGFGLLPPITQEWLARYGSIATHGVDGQPRHGRY
jgi:inner membrane protein